MKTVILTPNSSVKSTTTIESNPSERRDSFYFPGCRKDANCTCQICIASINATLDLMPHSIHRSPLTKLSTSRPTIPRTPVSFASLADPSTPKSSARISPVTMSPLLNSAASMSFQEKVKRRKREFVYGVSLMKFLLALTLVFGLEYGVSWMVSGVLKTTLTPDIVKSLGEKAWDLEGLNARFLFLKNKLGGLVGSRVSSCTSVDSAWKVNQDGLLLNSRCVLYESMAEEVSIWGWPSQTTGLLTAEFSSRSFSIVSGRVTEWSTREAKYLVREANSSWEQGRWSSCMVQFDPNTWILEYKQRFLLENSRLVSSVLEFLKLRLTAAIEKMKQEFLLPSAFGRGNSDFTAT
ncbi:hypothetical protein Sango_2871100 [Sesamum angolense]|uniref:Uncharacterized protein n=1 Tax=Sesamum angolense TaxID=2727404 RepID=A0AAE1T6H5_9LAMI|nr:hypothetical protein Sango_2871100 [Sesamum angolense]